VLPYATPDILSDVLDVSYFSGSPHAKASAIKTSATSAKLKMTI
jgi:hypothetical protein